MQAHQCPELGVELRYVCCRTDGEAGTSMDGKSKLRSGAFAIFCAVAAAVLLAACAGCSAAGKSVDCGWGSFDLPDGYVQIDDLPDHATISTSSDTDPKNYKLDERTIQIAPKVRDSGWSSAQSGMEKQASKYPDKFAGVESVRIGDRDWHVSAYTFKDEGDSVMGSTDVTGSRCIVFQAYYMSLDDPDLQKVLETLVIDESKLP